MKNKDQTQEIKKALLQGGLVFADRCSGKTKALAEILFEDSDAVVIVDNSFQSQTIKKYLLEKGLSYEAVKEKVVTAQFADKYLIEQRSNKNIYVDEWYLNSYRGYFKAAVTSLPFPVKVVKEDSL